MLDVAVQTALCSGRQNDDLNESDNQTSQTLDMPSAQTPNT